MSSTGGAGGRTGAGGASSGGAAGGAVPGAGGAGAGATACPPQGASARAKCTGTSPVTCHFGGGTGNYNVTVMLGGATAGKTEVQTEAARQMLLQTDTPAGQTQCYSFTVNVRQPEGQPIQFGANDGTPGLDMYFRGAAPLLSEITYAPVTSRPTMLFIAGDSTVCDDDLPDGSYAGWGQELPVFFAPGLSVANYADSGESSASFLRSASLWGAITAGLQAKDIVLIQFGHNDKSATEASNYKKNITQYVTDVLAKNAIPILVTPTARAQFTGNQVNSQHIVSGVNYPQTVRDIGKAMNIPVIDLTTATSNWLMQVGPNGWQAYHGVDDTNNKADGTHTNKAGAQLIAGFVRDAINQLNITELKKFLR